MIFSLAYIKDTTFLPVTFFYVHRSVGVSLNSYATFIYMFILRVSMINKVKDL